MLIKNMSLFCVDLNREKKCEEDYIKCSWGGECGRTEGQVCIYEKCKRKAGGWESEGGGGKGQKVKGPEVLCVLLMQFKDWIESHIQYCTLFSQDIQTSFSLL